MRSNEKLDLILDKLHAMESDTFTRFDKLEKRMDEFGTRLDGFDTRMDEFDKRFDGFNTRMDKFDKRLDGFDEIIDGIAKQVANHSAQFEILKSEQLQIKQAVLDTNDSLKAGQDRQDKILETLSHRSLEHEADIKSLKRVQQI